MASAEDRQDASGITAPAGFLAAGIHAGIKKPPALDLALVASVRTGPVAGVFTNNQVPAAPVQLGRSQLRRRVGRAFLINSGNANACTGPGGLANAREMAALAAHALKVAPSLVFVSSTGVIGRPLPMPCLRTGIPQVTSQLRRDGGHDAAEAILTTDTRIKEVRCRLRVGGRLVTIGGMAKGSGMIHPAMATMLAYVTTDAVITQPVLQAMLKAVVQDSFNCISVDGDTSTNDTVLCLANGMAGNRPLDVGSPDLSRFERALHEACLSLARQICWDGEGVTKLVKFQVTGARSHRVAARVADTVATSCLVKTALFGEDANWGRVMAAVGRAGVPLHPSRVRLSFDDVPIVKGGRGLGASAEARLTRVVRRREFVVTIDLGQGQGSAHRWSTDLSYDYVKINASYRS